MGILFDFSSDAYYKYNRFFKTLLEKSLEFVLYKKDGIIVFNLSLVLLPAKIDLITEKQNCKKDTFRDCGTNYVKIILALLAKVVALYMWGFII